MSDERAKRAGGFMPPTEVRMSREEFDECLRRARSIEQSKLEAKVASLEEQVAELRADAERYRWLQERNGNELHAALGIDGWPEDIDAAIDTLRLGMGESR